MKRSCRGFDILSSSKLMLRPKTNKLRLKTKKYFQREERVCLCDCWPRPPRLMQVLNASQQSEHRFPTFAIFISGMRLAVSENFQQRPPNCSTLGPQKILVSYTLSQSFCSCLTTLLMSICCLWSGAIKECVLSQILNWPISHCCTFA